MEAYPAPHAKPRHPAVTGLAYALYGLMPLLSAIVFTLPQLIRPYGMTLAEWLPAIGMTAALWYAQVAGSAGMAGLNRRVYQGLAEAQLLGCILFILAAWAAAKWEPGMAFIFASIPLSIAYGVWRLRRLGESGFWTLMPYFIGLICMLLNQAGILPGI